MTEILTTDAIQQPGGVAPWFGQSVVTAIVFGLDSMATEQCPITIRKTFHLTKISTDFPAWVRLYNTEAAMDADDARLINEDPISGNGLVFEAITTTDKLSITTSPVPLVWNDDVPRSSIIYASITNLDMVQRTITTTLTHLPLED